MTATEGLLLFIVVAVCDVLGLLVDSWLLRQGLPSITATVRSGSWPGCTLGVASVLAQFLAGFGLAKHFLG